MINNCYACPSPDLAEHRWSSGSRSGTRSSWHTGSARAKTMGQRIQRSGAMIACASAAGVAAVGGSTSSRWCSAFLPAFGLSLVMRLQLRRLHHCFVDFGLSVFHSVCLAPYSWHVHDSKSLLHLSCSDPDMVHSCQDYFPKGIYVWLLSPANSIQSWLQ